MTEKVYNIIIVCYILEKSGKSQYLRNIDEKFKQHN